jgi:glycosyltransferase involved in cell wall biosynthesis
MSLKEVYMNSGIINLYTDFSNFGGAQSVCYLLYKELFPTNRRILMGFTPFSKINERFSFSLTENYVVFSVSNVLKYKDFIFISHHRKITTYLCLIKRFFLTDLKIVHVAHNEFYDFNYFTLFPQYIIAVSEKVKFNLESYFSLSGDRVSVIYNGLCDFKNKRFFHLSIKRGYIKILYPARINSVKQQLHIVKTLSGSLNPNISIDFVGDGPLANDLKLLCSESLQFNYLGFQDISSIIHKYNFVMLFSKNEGLPLSLIESCMFGVPILCNNVGGNFEILKDGINGYSLSGFDNLVNELNLLTQITPDRFLSLSNHARKTYENFFTLNRMIDSYSNFLSNI